MPKFLVEIDGALFSDIKDYLENDLAATYVEGPDQNIDVFRDALKEGTLSMVVEDPDRLLSDIVVSELVPEEVTQIMEGTKSED